MTFLNKTRECLFQNESFQIFTIDSLLELIRTEHLVHLNSLCRHIFFVSKDEKSSLQCYSRMSFRA
jgi:hypothetical protein